MAEIEAPLITMTKRSGQFDSLTNWIFQDQNDQTKHSTAEENRNYSFELDENAVYSPFSYPWWKHHDKQVHNNNSSQHPNEPQTLLSTAMKKAQMLSYQVNIWEMVASSKSSTMLSLSLRKLYQHVTNIVNTNEEQQLQLRADQNDDEYSKSDPVGLRIDSSDYTRPSSYTSKRNKRASRNSIVNLFDRSIDTILEEDEISGSHSFRFSTRSRRNSNPIATRRRKGSLGMDFPGGSPRASTKSYRMSLSESYDRSTDGGNDDDDDDDQDDDIALQHTGDIRIFNSLMFRDIRSLDFEYNPHLDPDITIRRHCVIIILDPIRAIIMADRLLLIIPPDGDSLIGALDTHLRDWRQTYSYGDHHRKTSHVTFESYVYEALLVVLHALQGQHFHIREKQLLEDLLYFQSGTIFPIQEQEMLRYRKHEIIEFIQKIQYQRDVLIDLLNCDEAMALMNLSLLYHHPEYYRLPLNKRLLKANEEIEDLFEAYIPDFSSLLSRALSLLAKIKSSEDMIASKLDTSQNELLVVHWSVAVLMCSVSFSAYITGICGMNLDQKAFDGSFIMVFVVTGCMIAIVLYSVRWYFQYSGMLPTQTSPKIFVLDIGRVLFNLIQRQLTNQPRAY